MIEQILSYRTLVFNTVTTISYAFLPAMNKSLRAVLVRICTSGGNPVSLSPLLKRTIHRLAVLISTGWSPQTLQALMNVNGCHFFSHGWIQWHTFASYTLPYQTPFCQTAPLLPSVTLQLNVTEYWWEGSTSPAIPPPSASDIMGQHHKTGVSYEASLTDFFHKAGERKHP